MADSDLIRVFSPGHHGLTIAAATLFDLAPVAERVAARAQSGRLTSADFARLRKIIDRAEEQAEKCGFSWAPAGVPAGAMGGIGG